MKKNIKSISVVLLALVSFAACDVLNKEPLDQFTNENYWSGSANVEAYANVFFNQFYGFGNGTSTNGWFFFKCLSDDQAGREFQDWDHKSLTTTNSNWNNAYTEIRRANVMIEKVADMPATAITEVSRNHWLGVGRLMRAWEHYQLVRMFGDVVWMDHVPATNDPILYAAQNDRDEVMNKVLLDLNFAVENISTKKNSTGWSVALALAMKSEICLYEGTFCKYRTLADNGKAADENRAKLFLTASAAASEAIMAMGYSLNTDYKANYSSIDLKDNPEMILYKHYVKDVFMHSTIDYTSTSTKQHGITKDAFDSFLKLDGTLAGAGEDRGVYDATKKCIDLTNLLATRDLRLTALIDPRLIYTNNPYDRYGQGNNATTSSTGYGIWKYDNPELGADYRQNGNKNYTDAPLFWYSVILLNEAEAKAELGECTDQILNNTVNLLRQRAGITSLITTAGNGVDATLVDAIRRERRCELMCDNWNRYWDLVRWHQLDKLGYAANPNTALGAYVKDDPEINGVDVNADGYIEAAKGHIREWNTKYYLYPIPSSQIALNPNLKQNPGW